MYVSIAGILLLVGTSAFAQIKFEPVKKVIPKRELPISSLYIDLLGNAYTYSLNFDYIGKSNLGFRAGITPYFDISTDDDNGFFRQQDDRYSQSFLLIGMGNYFLGKGVHKLETGIGFVFSVNADNIRPGLPDYPALTGTIGYRLLPNKENIMTRLAFTPILSGGKFFPHFGFSIGYIF